MRDAVFKRLQSLQTTMMRHVLHLQRPAPPPHTQEPPFPPFRGSEPASLPASPPISPQERTQGADLFPVDRIVKNDSVSRAITKGILDGDLLAAFEYLSLDQQMELAQAVGTDPDTVLANLRNLRGYE